MTENIRQLDDPTRFEISVDGEVAGFAEYVDRPGRRIFHHTEIDPAFGGRGLAGVVVEHALTATRDAGLRIVPVCSYVQRWVEKHPQWQESVDKPRPDDLEALRGD